MSRSDGIFPSYFEFLSSYWKVLSSYFSERISRETRMVAGLSSLEP